MKAIVPLALAIVACHAAPRETARTADTLAHAAAPTRVAPPADTERVTESHFSFARTTTQNCPGSHTVNRRFLPDLTDSVVYVETSDIEAWRCEDYVISTLSLAEWPVDAVGVGSPLWTYTGEGEPGQVDPMGAFYRVVIPGAAGKRDFYRYVNLKTGKMMFEGSGPLVQLDPSETMLLARYVSVHDNYSAVAIPESKSDTTVVGALMYGSPEGPIQRALLRVDGSGVYQLDSLAFLFARDPTPRFEKSPDPRGIRDVSIAGRLMSDQGDPTLIFDLPIVADQLDVAHARLSDGLRIQIVQQVVQ